MSVDALEAALTRTRKSFDQHLAKRKKTDDDITPVSVIQLPLWKEDKRGVPNALVRSALFTVGNRRQKRREFKEEIVASLSNIKITYTGEELRQSEEDVFLQVLHLARISPLGDSVEFTAHAMLQAIGWKTDGASYKRLKSAIIRLKATSLTITQLGSNRAKRAFGDSLIRNFEYEEYNGIQSKYWKISLEPNIIALFSRDAYTLVDWEQRKQLGTLGKWLHSFYMSHRNPFAYKTETIKILCGSSTKELFKFRQTLKKSLDELKSVEFIDYWMIDKSDKVFVRLAPTKIT